MEQYNEVQINPYDLNQTDEVSKLKREIERLKRDKNLLILENANLRKEIDKLKGIRNEEE